MDRDHQEISFHGRYLNSFKTHSLDNYLVFALFELLHIQTFKESVFYRNKLNGYLYVLCKTHSHFGSQLRQIQDFEKGFSIFKEWAMSHALHKFKDLRNPVSNVLNLFTALKCQI